ncbi:MAG: DNA polymerase III subunit alpha [Bacteroidales bacterium]|nr:DNA polymerase III subunit alpha [Bacteroidales bacterium]
MYLNCHSYYSLRYGTMAVETLVENAAGMGIETLALTDINNSTGMVDFVRACQQHGIHPMGGIEYRNGDQYLYTGIARNPHGYRELNSFLSYHNHSGLPLPERAPPLGDVWFIYDFSNNPWQGKSAGARLHEQELIGVKPGELNRLFTSPWSREHSRLVIRHPVSFLHKSDHTLHRHLRAIDHNMLLSQLKPGQMADESEILLSPDLLRCAYDEAPHIRRNTEELVKDCRIDFDFTTVKNKKTFTGTPQDDKVLLEKLAMDGMEYRYGRRNPEALKRIRHELEIIDRLGFSSYFLITWDVIRYSMSRGFYHVGRGSGGNSIVAYCLRITDVDPIDLDLYFERFINPKRTSPPDFDIDFSWKERDEVLDYIFKRYGRKHTALIGTISTFRDRSIFRELGKVYGLPKEEIDLLVKDPGNALNENHITRNIFEVGSRLMDFPNLRSIHAGGVLISEEPLSTYTALDMPPKGLPTTQWDMYVAETLGFEKLDILSQRGIGHIKECAEIIRRNRGLEVDVHRVDEFKKDHRVLEQLKSGETNGCFYIESPAMRGLLTKLRCDSYRTLVAASSIIRPGVAQSGMMREYIHRFHHPGSFEYLHPIMEEQLKETFGVMVYQEDVIRICHHFAGLDLADADVLRRAMSGKYRSRKEFDRIADRFFENCRQRGYPDSLTREVWRQISSFAAYSFSKAHSASFAVESFQSLYLKAHYPLEFMTAVINNFGGYYRTWVYFNEARRWGGIIHLPCVNRSDYKTSISNKDIFIGFIHIQSLEQLAAEIITREREQHGEYQSLEDFLERVPLGLEQVIILIRVSALRFTGKSKKELLWDAHLLLGKRRKRDLVRELFPVQKREFTLPGLEQTSLENSYDELEILGFTVSIPAFELLQTSFRGEILSHQMMGKVGKKVRMIGNLVTVKHVRTKQKQWMNFGTFLDVEGEFFDVVNFPDSLKRYPYRGDGIYLLYGEITEEFGFPGMTVEKMARLPYKPDPRY